MATLVLAAAGSAVGTAIGGSFLGVSAAVLGQGIGAFAGSFIDSAIFGGGGQRLPDVVGGRLDNLQVQVSTYGKAIPHVYGYARLAGNVIWARNIKETETRTTTSSGGGGKGGAGGGEVTQTTVSYSYTATLAIAICEGEIDEIVRVWADSKQLDANLLAKAQGKYEVFTGAEDQDPSAIMEAYEGAGEVPAYRGIAYVVIEDFPLADYGNRIPNFTFEVRRKVKFVPSVEDKIKSIIMIPGSGEFVYSRDIVEKYVVTEDENGVFHQTGATEKVNMHNFDGVANVELAVDQMLETLPNLEWVALVVTWFITSKDAGAAEIIPKVEYLAESATTTPVEWSVGSWTRSNAEQILFFGDGVPTYGGTPSDKSVVDLCAYLKSKGLSVMLYPIPMVDTIDTMPGEDNKPWRGRVTPASAGDVTAFFTGGNGYNNFIRHYSQLTEGGRELRDYLDAFVLGSEMIGLTSYDSGSNTYPAVSALKSLAASVRGDLNGGTKIIYAADWSEYHSTGGYYNMDPLWTDANIDIVGIDAYFPITPDLPPGEITEAKIREYWEKGEGWDYYYSDPINRTGLTSYSGDPTFAWKNVEHWWNSTHYNPGSIATGWTPKLKPIWFTEYGFPSVDACANQPNVFYDPKSIESFFPRRSKGRVDFQAQRAALNATEDYLEARNQESGLGDLVPRRFVWTWDARPFPFWPDLRNVWFDYVLWPTGHWINGKMGNSTLGAIIAQLLAKVHLQPSDYDVSRLTQQVDGFIVDSVTTPREAIELLRAAYQFDMVESDGLLKFVNRGGAVAETITEDELIPLGTGDLRPALEIARAQELDMPKRVNVSYINRVTQYQTGTQFSQRQVTDAVDQVNMSLPIVMSDQFAKSVADINLYSAWVARMSYSLRLPPAYAALEPTDVITVSVNGVDHIMRVVSATMDRGAQAVSAVAEDVASYDFYTPPGESGTGGGQGFLLPETGLTMLDLPALPNDTGNEGVLRAAMTALGENWRGSTLFRSLDGGESGGNTFSPIGVTTAQAVKGVVLNNIGVADPQLFDMMNTIDVAILVGNLASVTYLALLNGANAAVVGDEIIQFQTATLTAPGRYTLSGLLRGRMGTEHEVGLHVAGEDFVLLDSALLNFPQPAVNFGLTRFYKAVTAGAALADTQEAAFTYTGKTLRPYSPVHIAGARDMSDNLTITWVRRTRLGGALRDGVDVPLAEESERYVVEILDFGDVVRTIDSLTSPSTIYSAADQTADFGGPQSSIDVRIYQLSASYGRGVPGEATI